MPESFRIASFNVENLLHPGVQWLGRADRAYTQAEYDEKIHWIRGILTAGKVDLVGFQELFSETALNDAVATTDLKNVVAHDLTGGKNITVDANGKKEASGPYVGLASRFPIVSSRSIADYPAETSSLKVDVPGGAAVALPLTKFQRPVLEAKIEIASNIVATVFVTHLKSKRSQLLAGEDAKNPIHAAMGAARSLIVRATEAVALRQLVVEATQNTNTPVFLFGDLNDDLASVTTQIIAGEEPYRFAQFPDKLASWDRLLYSVHDLQAQQSYRDVSYTHIYGGRYELLDHVFVSQEFYVRNSKRIGTVVNTRIFNDHLTDERLVASPERGPSLRSDHGIPVAEIVWQ